MIIVPLASVRKPEDDGGRVVMVNANGSNLVYVNDDELVVVVAAGVSMVDRATLDDSDRGRGTVDSSRRMVLVFLASAMIVYSVVVVVGVEVVETAVAAMLVWIAFVALVLTDLTNESENVLEGILEGVF